MYNMEISKTLLFANVWKFHSNIWPSIIFQDYEDFETANEDDQLSVFLKLDNADKGNGVTSQVSWKKIL